MIFMKCFCGKKCNQFDKVLFCVNNDYIVFYKLNGKIERVTHIIMNVFHGLEWYKSYKILESLITDNAKNLQELCNKGMKITWEKMKRDGFLDKYLIKKPNGADASEKVSST